MKMVKSRKEDMQRLADIYNYYVRNTTVTFNTKELSSEQFEKAFLGKGDSTVLYTITVDDVIAGFGGLNRFNPKEAYDRSYYISIYLDEEYTGKGLGSRILTRLEEIAYDQGIRSLIALLCKENTASASLFSKNGYRLAGELKEAGEKFGRLLDVVYYQKNL